MEGSVPNHFYVEMNFPEFFPAKLGATKVLWEAGELTMEDFRSASPLFDDDVLHVTLDSAVAARDVPGGTAPDRVLDAVRKAQERLTETGAES